MYLKRGQLYVPDYNQILSVLCPAPFLHIPEGFDMGHFKYGLPIPMSSVMLNTKVDDIPETAVIRCAEFTRRRIMFFGDTLDAWECTEDGR